jgi:PST family polysaccharide transporter
MSQPLALVAARGGVVTLGAQAVRVLLQLASIAALSRLLTPEDFGLVAMVAAIIVVGEVVRDFGLSSAAVQVPDLSAGERTNLFWASTTIGSGLCLAAITLSPVVAASYGDNRTSTLLVSLSPVFVLNGLAAQFLAELSRSLRYGALAIVDVGSQVIGVGAAVGIAVMTHSYWALVAQQVLTSAVSLLLAVMLSGWRPGPPHRGDPIGRFVKFGGGLTGTWVLINLSQSIDKFLVGRAYGPRDTGLYSRAYQASGWPMLAVAAPMSRVALPVFARLQQDRPRYVDAMLRAQLLSSYVTVTIYLLLAGLGRSVMAILLGPGWSEVAPIFSILAVGCAFRVLGQVCSWMFVSLGLTGQQFRLYLVTQPLIWVLTVLGLTRGVIGVACGQALGFALAWVVSMMWIGRVSGIDVRPFFGISARVALAIGVPAGLLGYGADVMFASPVVAVGAAITATAVYAIAAALVSRRIRHDGLMLWRFLRRAASRA